MAERQEEYPVEYPRWPGETPDEELIELSRRLVAGEFADFQAEMEREYWENVRRAGKPVPQWALELIS